MKSEIARPCTMNDQQQTTRQGLTCMDKMRGCRDKMTARFRTRHNHCAPMQRNVSRKLKLCTRDRRMNDEQTGRGAEVERKREKERHCEWRHILWSTVLCCLIYSESSLEGIVFDQVLSTSSRHRETEHACKPSGGQTSIAANTLREKSNLEFRKTAVHITHSSAAQGVIAAIF